MRNEMKLYILDKGGKNNDGNCLSDPEIYIKILNTFKMVWFCLLDFSYGISCIKFSLFQFISVDGIGGEYFIIYVLWQNDNAPTHEPYSFRDKIVARKLNE